MSGVSRISSADPHWPRPAAASAGSRLLTSPGALQQDIADLQRVSMLLYSRGSAQEALNAFYGVSDETKNALYFWLWMSHRCPQEFEYGKKQVASNPASLIEATLPFLHSSQHNLLQQMIASLEARRDGYSLHDEQKTCYNRIVHNPYLPHEVKERFYLQLPHEVRAQVPSPVRGLLHIELGSHYKPEHGGTQFTLHAPHARQVYAVMSYGGNETNRFEMRKNFHTGYWEGFGHGVSPGATYYYEIITESGKNYQKIDPLAAEQWLYPNSIPRYHSVVREPSLFYRTDGEWMDNRKKNIGSNLPMNIYKVPALSWKPEIRSYRDLADELVRYCKDMSYTHVELSSILEHPHEDSQGYQPLTLCAPTSRLGTWEDFQYLVNHLHVNGIGVGIDFVPNHFAIDDCGLASFDGKSVFEHDSPETEYGAFKFNYATSFTRDYVISSANFWAERGIDFFRVDAVDSLNIKDNPASLYFIRALNDYLHHSHPGVLTIAEASEYTANVTEATFASHGWGFDAQQDLGRQHDILAYLQTDPFFRHYHHKQLVEAPAAIAGSAVNVLSHDRDIRPEVMPGDEWQQFANSRLLRCFQMLVPGKKMTYSGHEYAGRSWHDLDHHYNRGMHNMSRALNELYRRYRSLWESNDTSALRWIDTTDSANSVVSFHRGNLACVFNMTPNCIAEYEIFFPSDGDDRSRISSMREVFSSDDRAFGGSDQKNGLAALLKDGGRTIGFKIKLPPLGCAVFEESFG